MGYSNIIDSLVDNRSVISESGLLRDNKQILRKIEKQLHFFKEAFLVGGVSNNLFFIDWFINNLRMYSGYFGLRLRIEDSMYKWLEDGDNLYYCIDLNALLSYTSFYDFCNDTQVYEAFMTKLEEEVTLRTEQVVQNFFDEVRLAIPIKGRLINNTHLPLMRYDTKSQKVHTPNNGYIYNIDLMSRAGSGKDGRVILSIDDVLRGRFGLTYFNLPSIVTDNDYDIPLGGAF